MYIHIISVFSKAEMEERRRREEEERKRREEEERIKREREEEAERKRREQEEKDRELQVSSFIVNVTFTYHIGKHALKIIYVLLYIICMYRCN